jgi:FixJ family two-component response regulator
MKNTSPNLQSAIPNPQCETPNRKSESPNPQSDAVVYVVDDDPSVRRGISHLLRAAGYSVEVFASAAEFLARPRSDLPLFETPQSPIHTPQSPIRNPQSPIRNPQSPSCLILDVQMPGLNGLQLQEALGGDGNSMPIIFMTGHGDIPMSVRAMKKGAVDFLAKPVDRKDLLAAIAVALRQDQGLRKHRAETAKIRKREQTLTPREREVMARVITGLLNKQIAAELGIEEGTVKVHRHRVMEKMGVTSVAELVKVNADWGMRNED